MRETVAPSPSPPSGRLSIARHITAWRQLLAWLAARPDELATAKPIKRVHRTLWLYFAVVVAFALANLVSVWWNSTWFDWMWFWGTVLIAAVLAFVTVPFGWWRYATQRNLEEVISLRDAATHGDDAVLPPTPVQPAPPPAGTFLVHRRKSKQRRKRVQPAPPASGTYLGTSLTVHSLRRVDALTIQSVGFVAVIWSFIGAEQVVFFFLLSQPAGRMWQSLVLGLTFIVAGLWIGTRMFVLRRPFTVSADEHGVTWRRWGRRHTIPWPEVRALGMIESSGWGWSPTWSWFSAWSISLPAHWAYWVEGTHDTLMFMPALPGQRLPPSAENDVSGAGDSAWQLCATVGAKTGLPLRDLTPAAMRVTTAWTSVRYRDYWRNLLVIPRGAASSAWGRLRYRIRSLTPLLLFVALLVAGLGMLVVQPHAYAARLAQAQSAKALLSDSMMKPSGLWPIGTTSRATYTYLSDGYWLGLASEVCCDVYALAPPTFHAATIEATVHQVSSFDLSEAGLVVRADDIAHTMLIFVVTPNGGWRLKRFHIRPDGRPTDEQTLMYESTWGGVAAIHQGLDATNRLAVMMRGTSYTFFINGQFVGGYQGDSPTSGHVGFYSDLSSDGVGFSDFVVYPAPPPSPLFPV